MNPVGELILVIDAGTTSTRAMVFDRAGDMRAVAQRQLQQHYPRPGWVEHDAGEIWTAALACVRQVVTQVGGADRLGGIGARPIVIERQRRTADDRRAGSAFQRGGGGRVIAMRMGAADRHDLGIADSGNQRRKVFRFVRAGIYHGDLCTSADDIGLRAGIRKRRRIARQHPPHQRIDGFGERVGAILGFSVHHGDMGAWPGRVESCPARNSL